MNENSETIPPNAIQVRVVSPITPPKAVEPVPASAVPQKPTLTQQENFTSFVTQYFGGSVLRESSVPAQIPTLSSAHTEESKQPVRVPDVQAIPKQCDDVPSIACSPAVEEISSCSAEPVQESLLSKDPANSMTDVDPLHGYQIVGVVFDTYILLQNDKQMLFIDQHAAHERILYERLMKQIDQGVGSQVLMVAQVVHVTPQDKAKIEQYAEEIRLAGFDIEPFCDDAYQIRAVPNVLGVPQSRGAFLDMVDRLGELRVLSTSKKRRDAILQMACKKAIKGGDKLTPEEIEPLLADMLATNAPPTCPHGRPLVLVVSRSDLEKRFRRINN